MDKSEVQEIVDVALPMMVQALKMKQWDITAVVCGSHDRTGEATMWPEYERVRIQIGADEMATSEDVYECLWHELLHGVASEYELVLDLTDKMVGVAFQEVLRAAMIAAHEKTARRLQRVLDWRKLIPYLDQQAKRP